eukprot:COSAG01_NODE_16144_length_1266_cov_1.037704_1_plen_150_part_10
MDFKALAADIVARRSTASPGVSDSCPSWRATVSETLFMMTTTGRHSLPKIAGPKVATGGDGGASSSKLSISRCPLPSRITSAKESHRETSTSARISTRRSSHAATSASAATRPANASRLPPGGAALYFRDKSTRHIGKSQSNREVAGRNG